MLSHCRDEPENKEHNGMKIITDSIITVVEMMMTIMMW